MIPSIFFSSQIGSFYLLFRNLFYFHSDFTGDDYELLLRLDDRVEKRCASKADMAALVSEILDGTKQLSVLICI